MLRIYEYAGGTYQFHDEDVPEGAVLVGKPAPKNKARKAPTNKGGTSASSGSVGNSKPAGEPAKPATD